MNVRRKVIYGLQTTKIFDKFNKLNISIECIFYEQGSADFTGLSKGFKKQEN